MRAGGGEPEDESELNVCAAESIFLPSFFVFFVHFSALRLARQQLRHSSYGREFHPLLARSAKLKAFLHQHFFSWSVRQAGRRQRTCGDCSCKSTRWLLELIGLWPRHLALLLLPPLS